VLQYETLRTIELTTQQVHQRPDRQPGQGRKPFFNVVTFRKNVAIRATDLGDVNLLLGEHGTTLQPNGKRRPTSASNAQLLKHAPPKKP
jgi:hypothetical protein